MVNTDLCLKHPTPNICSIRVAMVLGHNARTTIVTITQRCVKSAMIYVLKLLLCGVRSKANDIAPINQA